MHNALKKTYSGIVTLLRRYVFFFCALLILVGLIWFAVPSLKIIGEARHPDALKMPPEEVALHYGRALSARDFSTAYRFISAADQRLKDEESYIREQGSFSGFPLEVSKQLAGFIEVVSVEKTITGDRAEVTLKVSLPNANAPALQELLSFWDEEKLNALPHSEQQAMSQQLDQWQKEGKIPRIEGEQKFTLVQEEEGWRVFLNWAAGTQLSFHTLVPPSLPLEATPVQKEVVVLQGEMVQVYFRVKNRSDHDVSTHIIHHVEPKTLAEYLELVECGLLFPVSLKPGEEEEYLSVYLVRGDIPGGKREFKITYEFAPPENKQ